jgi:hypothetical protein
MAVKLKTYYIRDLNLTPLNIIDLEFIIYNISPSIRLNWGKEYIDFNFTTPIKSPDSDIKKTLKYLKSENISIGLYPTNGSYELLGRGISKNSIDIKTYNLKEFCEMSKKATEFIAMYTQSEKIDSRSSNHSNLENNINLFHTTKIKSYIDYSYIITELEKNKFVNTFSSENILRTDERRFSLNAISKKINPAIDLYIGNTYEVDSLGTNFYSELSQEISFLYSRYFKDRLI